MLLDDIWDEPVASPSKSVPDDDDANQQKRPRQSLFFSDSDSERERPPKRATPAPPQPDVDALFEDLDKDEEDADLRYKPLAPALDLDKLAKEATAKHARAKQTGPSQTLTGSSKAGLAGDSNKFPFEKDDGKGKTDDGEKKGRRVLPKLDEERLIGPDGFPLLIKEIEGFKPKGKGHEHADLNRLLQVYQFWSHKMYPKTSFKDTINRVEKLCHSKRMQVRLSVWRDEFKGIAIGKQADEDPDVIDLTEPTLVATEDDGDKHSETPQVEPDRASSNAPSLPPASSEVDDDDFDIEAVIKAEEERLAKLRGTTEDSRSPGASRSPTLAEKTPSTSAPEANAMDVDEASLWETFDDQTPVLDPPPSGPPSSVPADDEDMWNIVDEMEQGEQHRPAGAAAQIPLSGVNLIPSLESSNSGNAPRPTNDDDWDEMYS